MTDRPLARWLLLALPLLLITACGDRPPADPAQAVARERERAFALCAGCHTVQPGAIHRYGPNLHGVLGRRAGSLADYPYSDAMRGSGLVWDEQTLDTFLSAPSRSVPGTRMYNAFPDPRRRQQIIEYLREHAQ